MALPSQLPPSVRVWLFVDVPTSAHGCWLWTRALSEGYGVMGTDRRVVRVHRFLYEILRGPIPDGLELDHLCHSNDDTCAGGTTCRHRRCVNPWHLQPVTTKENADRATRTRINGRHLAHRTHCKNGHEFTPENTRITSRGSRTCRQCNAESARRRRARS